jgi:hypothetical protein
LDANTIAINDDHGNICIYVDFYADHLTIRNKHGRPIANFYGNIDAIKNARTDGYTNGFRDGYTAAELDGHSDTSELEYSRRNAKRNVKRISKRNANVYRYEYGNADRHIDTNINEYFKP